MDKETTTDLMKRNQTKTGTKIPNENLILFMNKYHETKSQLYLPFLCGIPRSALRLYAVLFFLDEK